MNINSPSSIESWTAAVMAGDVDLVSHLMKQYPELAGHVNDQLFPFESTAVFQSRDNLPMLDLLLEHGANLNQKTGWRAGGFGILEGIEPNLAQPLIDRGAILDIWSATGLNRAEDVIRILDEQPDLITAAGGDGKHPIHYADNPAMVDLLMERGADINARDVDHASTPLQYQVNSEAAVRRMLKHGGEPDIFLAAALGDLVLARRIVGADPAAADARLGNQPWTNSASGNIYNWMLGHDLTPIDVARDRGHDNVVTFLLESCSRHRKLTDAIWCGDRCRVDRLRDDHPSILDELSEDDRQLLARAAWWYRPEAVRIMLDLGFDPHVSGVHDSTPLDRASFHGYADIVEMLLDHDPQPPIDRQNEFGGTPLGACLHGWRHGWETGHPRRFVETIRLLIDAGSQPNPKWDRTGDPIIDNELFGD